MLTQLTIALWISLAAQAEPLLSIAAMNGDAQEVRKLIAQKADVNLAQGDGTTALHWAAHRDDLDMAQALIAAGANPNVKTRLGEMSPLFMAAKGGSAPMIEALLKAGASAKTVMTTTGTTALMLAAASGNVDAVKALIAAGSDVNARDINHGQTALMFAAAAGRTDAIRALAKAGADVKATSLVPDPKRTPGGPPGPAKRFIALGGLTALQFAAREGHRPAMEALIEAGADINQPTASNGMSALTIALLNGKFDLSKFMLERGADPNVTGKDGITSLFAVIDARWANRVWYPPPSTDEEHTSHLELISLMLKRGANPDARLGERLWHRQFHNDWIDPVGGTAFWRAAQANDVAAMKLLVAGGANPNIPSLQGCSPLQVAAGFGYEPQASNFVPDGRLPAIRYLVEELGADVNARDNRGYTPLHGAGLTHDNPVIEYLVAMGADVQARARAVFGAEDSADRFVAVDTGDSVVDMANGPRPHNLVHPETVALLERMGSPNSDNCRASNCVNKTKPNPTKQTGRQ